MNGFESGLVSYILIGVSILVSLFVWSHKQYMSYGFHREYYERGENMNFLKQIAFFQFIHGDVLHLVMNMYFLSMAGPVLESYLGSWNYLIFFFVITILSSFALYFFAPKSNTIGISGFCMAILAYLWVALSTAGDPGASEIGTLLLINIALGFIPGISLVGHAAGALGGVLFWYITNSII